MLNNARTKRENVKTAGCPVQYENHVCVVLSMTGDLNALRVILLYHFSNGIFINGGLEGGVTNLIRTLQGNNLQVLSVCTIIIQVCSLSSDSKRHNWIFLFCIADASACQNQQIQNVVFLLPWSTSTGLTSYFSLCWFAGSIGMR